MGELTVTGLDEELLTRLSSLAAAHGRSLDEEARAILAAEIRSKNQTSQVSKEEWLAMAAESRRQSGPMTVRTIDLLHESRDERLADLCG